MPSPKISLGKLALLDRLLATRSVTATAEALGRTQPSVTAALNDLRAHYGDPLLVREGARLRPTPFALLLAQDAAAFRRQGERLAARRKAFAPETANRDFTVRATDYLQSIFAPAMIAVVAPHEGLSLRFFMTDASRGEALGSARADFAFHVSGPLEAGSASRVLFVDPFVTVWDPRHGAAPASLDRFCARAHVLATPEGGEFGAIDAKLRDVGRARRIAARTQNVFSAVRLVAGSPLVAVAPRSVAEEIARAHGLEIGRPPIALPPASISLVWSKSTEADPACAWFREGVFARFGASAARGGPGRKSAKS